MAVKIIQKNPEAMNEVHALREVHHANVIQLREHFEEHEKVYLVLDLAKGGDLLDTILEAPGGYLKEDRAQYYFLQLLSGLQATLQ